MKKIFFLSLLVLPLFFSCEKETEGVSRTTYYPTLEVLGAPIVVITQGEAFVDPGFTAELNGEDVADQVVVTGLPDINTPGKYNLTYTITNADGIGLSGTRVVYVADKTSSPVASAVYTVAEGTYRYWKSSGAKVPFKGQKVVVSQIEPGVFYVDCIMGGYYSQYLNRGPVFDTNAKIRFNSDNTFTLLWSYNNYWKDPLDGMTASSFDPATGKITWTVGYAGLMDFNVILSK